MEDTSAADLILDIPEPESTARYERLGAGYIDTSEEVKKLPKLGADGQLMPGTATPIGAAEKIGMFQHAGKPVGDAGKAHLVSLKQTEEAPTTQQGVAKKELRKQFEVTMGPTMKIGSPPRDLDTAVAKAPEMGSAIVPAMLGTDPRDSVRFAKLSEEWKEQSLIWVCTTEKGRIGAMFYSGVGKVNKFHHSSFTAGSGLIGAGEWIVVNGKLKRVNGNSGHYQPTLRELHQAVLYMEPAWQRDTEVMLYNKEAQNWDYVPVLLFKSNASGGGKYIAHPCQSS